MPAKPAAERREGEREKERGREGEREGERGGERERGREGERERESHDIETHVYRGPKLTCVSSTILPLYAQAQFACPHSL